MDSSVRFLRVSQRKNPKRGIEVQEYQVHCVNSSRETLMTLVLEKITQELDPALQCKARICLHLVPSKIFLIYIPLWTNGTLSRRRSIKGCWNNFVRI